VLQIVRGKARQHHCLTLYKRIHNSRLPCSSVDSTNSDENKLRMKYFLFCLTKTSSHQSHANTAEESCFRLALKSLEREIDVESYASNSVTCFDRYVIIFKVTLFMDIEREIYVLYALNPSRNCSELLYRSPNKKLKLSLK
jgi:hypothetical protein